MLNTLWVWSAAWLDYIFILLFLSYFLSAPESIDSWRNGDWCVSGWYQETHTTLYCEFTIHMWSHVTSWSLVTSSLGKNFIRLFPTCQLMDDVLFFTKSSTNENVLEVNHIPFFACYTYILFCVLGPCTQLYSACNYTVHVLAVCFFPPLLCPSFSSDWSKWILLCHWPQWIRPAASQSPAKGMATGPMHHFVGLSRSISWNIVYYSEYSIL